MVSCERDKVIKDAKHSCSKYLAALRGKLHTSSEELTQLIYGAFHRSLAIYYFTPLFAAGLINREFIDNYETQVIRKHLRIPNDVKSKVIQSVFSNFVTPTSEVIFKQAYNNRLFVTEDKKKSN